VRRAVPIAYWPSGEIIGGAFVVKYEVKPVMPGSVARRSARSAAAPAAAGSSTEPVSDENRNTTSFSPPNWLSISALAWLDSEPGSSKPSVWSLPNAVTPSAAAATASSAVTSSTPFAWDAANRPIRPNMAFPLPHLNVCSRKLVRC
jgi:hypothetical protein